MLVITLVSGLGDKISANDYKNSANCYEHATDKSYSLEKNQVIFLFKYTITLISDDQLVRVYQQYFCISGGLEIIIIIIILKIGELLGLFSTLIGPR